MGKKSKSKSKKSPPCYHGCLTKKEFNSGAHHQTLDEDLRQLCLADQTTLEEKCKHFHEFNKRDMGAIPAFGNFVIAHIADDFLKNGKDDPYLRSRLLLLLRIRYFEIPWHENKEVGPGSEYYSKFHKYVRDISTERGRINCMAREIPCNCLEEKRIQAKAMDRVAICYGCRQEYSKKQMLRCNGCNYVQYCSGECRLKAWPEHKVMCRSMPAASAPKPL